MITIMNTDEHPRRQRSKIWTETFLDAVVPMTVTFEEPDRLSGRMEGWRLGDVDVLRSRTNTGKGMQLSADQARHSDEPKFSIGLQLASTGRFEQFGAQSEVLPGHLHCVDISEEFAFGWTGPGSSVALIALSAQDLGLPVDTIRRGATQIRTSPLFPLISRHLTDALCPQLEQDPGAYELGVATIELCRALLVSAAQDARHQRTVMSETLLTRICAYTRQHLHDSDLTAQQIAAAHHISLRYLYKLCSNAGFSLEQWIITQRLRGAYRELASSDHAQLTIATIARRWGFSDPAHFSRRFRQEFGRSPREWRATAPGRHDALR